MLLASLITFGVHAAPATPLRDLVARCADALTAAPVASERGPYVKPKGEIRRAHLWLKRMIWLPLGATGRERACRRLGQGVIAHEIVFTAHSDVARAFARVCENTPARDEVLTRITRHALNALPGVLHEYVLFGHFGKMDQYKKRGLFAWVDFASGAGLSPATWLAMLKRPIAVFVLAKGLGGDFGRVGLSEAEVLPHVLRFIDAYPGATDHVLRRAFGHLLDNAREQILAHAWPEALIRDSHRTGALDDRLVEAIHRRVWQTDVDRKRRIESLEKADAAIMRLIADPAVDLDFVRRLIDLVSKGREESMRTYWQPGDPAFVRRQMQVAIARPEWLIFPNTITLDWPVEDRNAYLRELIRTNAHIFNDMLRPEVLDTLPDDLTAAFLRTTGRSWLPYHYIPSPFVRHGRLRRWWTRRRAQARGERKELASRTLWVQAWSRLDAAGRAEALRDVHGEELLGDVLGSSLLSRADKLDLIYRYAAYYGEDNELYPSMFAGMRQLTAAITMSAEERRRLTAYTIRLIRPEKFDLEKTSAQIAEAFGVPTPFARRILFSESIPGVLGDSLDLNTPFKTVEAALRAFQARHPDLVDEDTLNFVLLHSGNTATLAKYLRVLAGPDRERPELPSKEKTFLAQVLGLESEVFDHVKLSEAQTRELRAVALDLDVAFGPRALAGRAFASEIFTRANVDRLLKMLRRLRLAHTLDQGVQVDAHASVSRYLGEAGLHSALTSEDLDARAVDLEARVFESARTLLADPTFALERGGIEVLERRWGTVEPLFTFLTRVQSQPFSAELLAQVRMFLAASLHGREAELKYDGAADNPLDQKRARAQLAMLDDHARALWHAPRARVELVDLDGGRAAWEADRDRKIAAVARQALIHARDLAVADGAGRAWVEALIARLSTSASTAEDYRVVAKDALVHLHPHDVPASFDGAAIKQIRADLKGVLNLLQSRPNARGEVVLLAATLRSPMPNLNVGGLVNASSCLDLAGGPSAHAAFSQVIDANAGLVVGFALDADAFQTPDDFARVREDLAHASSSVSVTFDERTFRARVRLAPGREVETKILEPIHRRILRVGWSRTNPNVGGLFAEQTYGPTHPAAAALATFVDDDMRTYAGQMKLEYGRAVRVVGTRSQGGLYSDHDGAMMEHDEEF